MEQDHLKRLSLLSIENNLLKELINLIDLFYKCHPKNAEGYVSLSFFFFFLTSALYLNLYTTMSTGKEYDEEQTGPNLGLLDLKNAYDLVPRKLS